MHEKSEELTDAQLRLLGRAVRGLCSISPDERTDADRLEALGFIVIDDIGWEALADPTNAGRVFLSEHDKRG
jgi:hypothetical protein